MSIAEDLHVKGQSSKVNKSLYVCVCNLAHNNSAENDKKCKLSVNVAGDMCNSLLLNTFSQMLYPE